MLVDEALKIVIVAGALLSVVLLSDLWQRLRHPPVELTRKASHIGSGLIVATFPWVFSTHWSVLFLSLCFVGVMLIARRFGLLYSIHGVKRSSLGDLYFVAAAYGLFLVSADRPVFYAIPILTLTLSDALAALVGVTYQKQVYTVEGHRRSVEGSAVFFLATFLIVHLPLLLCTPIERVQSVWVAFQIALLVTMVESVSLYGTDNLFIPAMTYYLLEQLVRAHMGWWVAWHLGLQVVLVLVGHIMAWRMKMVSLGGGICVFLFFYGAYSLGGPEWLAPPLIGLIVFAFSRFRALHGDLPGVHPAHYQVLAVFYICLVPALLFFFDNLFAGLWRLPALEKYEYFLFTPYVAAHAAATAVGITRLRWLDCLDPEKETLPWWVMPMISTLTFLAMVPASLALFNHRLGGAQLLVAMTICVASMAAYAVLYRRLHQLEQSNPVWRFRLESMAVAIGVAIGIPLHLWNLGIGL